MPRAIEKEIKRALWAAYPPSKRVAWLVNATTWDLYYGPVGEGEDMDGEPYPGFTAALDEIRGGLDTVPGEVWYDRDSGEILESEPEEYEEDGEIVEPYWEGIYHVKNVEKELLGKLSEYL